MKKFVVVTAIFLLFTVAAVAWGNATAGNLILIVFGYVTCLMA